AALNAPDEYIQEVVAEYERRRNTLISAIQEIPGVKVSRPKGAFYFVVDLPVDDAENFAIFMLRDFSYNGHTVFFAPAEDFYVSEGLGRKQARIAYVKNCEQLLIGAECLKQGLKEYRKRVMGIK
ncbi:MAG: pyridoxal phosphate-dependent aminotransferase, partial [Spirochaetales bacterium]|nr:pyridoxal phosphate-dependent aminotransferase [Spirochaetales bacterium]